MILGAFTGLKSSIFENFGKIFFRNFFLKLYKKQTSRPLGNIKDQALYDHNIIFLKKLRSMNDSPFLSIL